MCFASYHRLISTVRVTYDQPILGDGGVRPFPLEPAIESRCGMIKMIWIFTVLRPAQEYFTYMETSP
jgi:hypothetical protein